MVLIKMNQRKAGVLLSYCGIAIDFIIALFYTPIMLRLIGQTEYGLYSLVGSVVSYLSLLSLGLGSSYLRFYMRAKTSADKHAVSRVNGLYLLVFICIGLITFFFGMILIINSDLIFQSLSVSENRIAKVLLSLLVFNLAVSFPLSVFTSYLTANETFIFQKITTLTGKIVTPFLTLPLLFLGYGSIGMVVVNVLINIISQLFNAVYAIAKLKMRFSFSRANWYSLREIFGFSLLIFLQIIFDQINLNIGNLLLGIFSGATAVAVYGIGKTLFGHYMSFSTIVSSVFAPKVNYIVASKAPISQLSDLMIKVGRIQFMVLGLVLSGLFFFGRPFISLWAGSEYSEAYYVVLILCFAITVDLIQNLCIEIQRAMNLQRFRSIVCLICGAFNVLISIPLTISWGVVGAAMGTFISYTICCGIVMNWFYWKKMNLAVGLFWRNIFSLLPSFFLPAVLGFLINSTRNLTKWGELLVCIILYSIVYCLSVFSFGMNSRERSILFGRIKKVKHS